jgi:asparagine synthase (glutamine-hydrolysing)
LNRQLYVSPHETVLPTLLRNYDRYSMANGVEIRMPFLDHRILSFAFSIPWSSKIRNGFSKAIIRDAVAKYMPPEIAYRKTKIGFNSPVIDWIKGPLKNYLLQIIESDSFNKCELIDPIQVRTSVKNVIDDPRAKFIDGERVWIMLTPYFWERSVIKKN